MAELFDSTEFKQLLDRYSLIESNIVPAVVDLYSNPLKEPEKAYLKTVFGSIPNGNKKFKLQREFLREDAGSHWGAWAEMMVYDWLEQLNKSPILDPIIPGTRKTPDLLIKSENKEIFIEIAAVQRAERDESIGDAIRGWWPAATATFRSMGGRLDEKLSKYREALEQYPKPYVVCLFLVDSIIDLSEVKTYFLGGESYNFNTREMHQNLDGAVFEHHIGELPLVKYRHVTGVLVAKRNRQTVENGFMLEVGFIENPYATEKIDTQTFGDIRRYVVISEIEGSIQMGWKIGA